MRILFITRKFPPSIGGMELFAKDLSDVLARKTDLKLLKWGDTGQLKAVLVALPLLTLRGFLALSRGGIDVIHMQDGLLAPSGWLLSRLFRKPYTVIIHGLDITFTNPLFRLGVPWAVRRADTVFSISEAATIEALKRGVDKNKVVTIPIAVNDVLYYKSNTKTALRQQLSLDKDSQIMLSVGRLTKRKGVAWLIEAVLPDLVKQFPKLVYVIVGEGKNRAAIEAAIQQSAMADHVKLLGRVQDELYRQAYNGADVFVMPNINVPGDIEGFGLVNLEAALCALPVVAADTEGIRAAVTSGQNGVLVPVRDAKAFQARISEFLQNPKEAQQFGQEARQYTLSHYSWDRVAERYLEVYQKLARRPQTP